MRYVQRKLPPPPSLLNAYKKPNGQYYKASNKIIVGENHKFTGYKGQDVKDKLEEMFLSKCAYCESYYAHVQSLQVEHYRPKGGYKQERDDDLVEPGYYWLAWSWWNLLPSCIDCNQERYHIVFDGEREKLGKANLFPIEVGGIRATKPGDRLRVERPLLLHPSMDNPEEHLEFTDEGVVHAKLDASGRPSLRGEVSIKIYALQRNQLVQERARVASLIRAQIKRVDCEIKNMVCYPRDEYFMFRFKDELKMLFSYQEDDQPYSVMAKQIIKEYKSKLIRLGYL
jgi:uncharacterized protein (TIGR02646 family)